MTLISLQVNALKQEIAMKAYPAGILTSQGHVTVEHFVFHICKLGMVI